MKKSIFSILLLLSQLPLRAQTEKGRWNAGVGIGSFSYQSSETGHSFSGTLTPSVGTFAARNLLIGVGLPLSVSSGKVTYPQDYYVSHSTSIGLSPFIRYYFGTSALKPFVGAAISYSFYKSRNEGSVTVFTNKGTSLQLSPSVGLAYFINRSISVNVQVAYNWARFKSTSTDSSGGGTGSDNPATTVKNATLALGFNIFFGQ